MYLSLNDTPPLHIVRNKKLLKLLFVTFLLIFTGCSGSTSPDSENESDQEEPEEVTVTEKEAVDAVIQVIQDSGLTFPSRDDNAKNRSVNYDLYAMDYIELDTSPNGLIQIKLWVGGEGNIIPKPSWQAANENACSSQGRYMKGAVKLLQFTILSPSQEAQLNYIDMETSEIEQSVIGTEDENSDNDEGNWLTESMSDAWDLMQAEVSIGGAVGPCGEKIEMGIRFSSEITTDLTTDEEEPVVYFEHIKASFPLTFDEEKSAYTGTGDLEWVAWEFNGQPDSAPSGKSLEIVRLVTPEIDNPTYDDPALELELPGFEDGTPLINLSWPLIHTYEQNEAGDNYTYIIMDWEVSSDDESAVMTRTFDRTEGFTVDGDPVEITEKTEIEIVRD